MSDMNPKNRLQSEENEQIKLYRRKRAAEFKLNIDDEPALADQEQIELVPTLVLYRDGKAIGSIVAPESKAVIEQFIRESLEK